MHDPRLRSHRLSAPGIGPRGASGYNRTYGFCLSCDGDWRPCSDSVVFHSLSIKCRLAIGVFCTVSLQSVLLLTRTLLETFEGHHSNCKNKPGCQETRPGCEISSRKTRCGRRTTQPSVCTDHTRFAASLQGVTCPCMLCHLRTKAVLQWKCSAPLQDKKVERHNSPDFRVGGVLW